MKRCEWANASPLEQTYHDTEWGVPLHDDRMLFEFLVLGGAQAGLSWSIILKRRTGYRQAFDNFDVRAVANYTEDKVAELLANPGIIRNRLKIRAAISNAQAFLKVQDEFGSFDRYIWQFVNGQPIQNAWQRRSEVPANTPVSDKMSRDLKQRGFKFAGSTICYAFMQAAGLVNDHTTDCFRYSAVRELAEKR